MNVGFIGLGIMGTPMAANLVSAGHTLQTFDLKPVPASLADKAFNSCAAHGGAAWDHSAMVRALEYLANFEIGQKSVGATN
jgi:3-hydroxyisobutyrate dehydrogenase-like beta-hydroxyacid dehydrogenase